METVSVICPTYNRPAMILDAINTFLNQDYPEKEMIIVNDGSTKDYKSVIELCGNEHSVKFINVKENAGCPSAINVGIGLSAGSLICILADDDMLYDNHSLSNRVKAFDSDTEVVYTSYTVVNAKGKEMERHEVLPVSQSLIWKRDYINIQTMMWRKSIHNQIGCFSEDLINNEDWEWKIKCLMECNVKAVKEFTAKTRYHGQNKSMVNRSLTNECAGKLMKRMKEKYK